MIRLWAMRNRHLGPKISSMGHPTTLISQRLSPSLAAVVHTFVNKVVKIMLKQIIIYEESKKQQSVI